MKSVAIPKEDTKKTNVSLIVIIGRRNRQTKGARRNLYALF